MTAEEKFWRWFRNNEGALFDFELDRGHIFDRLSTELQRVHRNLTFEFGPKDNQRRKREFVISAGGIWDAFASVVALTTGAPPFDRWKVTAFRPRRWPLNSIQIADIEIDPEGVEFSLLDNGKIAGLYLYVPGYIEEDINYKQIGYLMLDEALGEYDVETGVGVIEMFPFETQSQFKRYPMKQLPESFDRFSQLKGRTGKPF
jgi:hypothetical protein